MKGAREPRSEARRGKTGKTPHCWEILASPPADCPVLDSSKYSCGLLKHSKGDPGSEGTCADCAAFRKIVQEDLRNAASPMEIIGFLANQIRLIQEREANTRTRYQRNEQQLTQMRHEIQAYCRQIQQAEKLAAVGELAAGVAHEINNPLAGILTFAKLALKKLSHTDTESPDSEVVLAAIADYVGRIAQEGERCRRIIQQLLDFSRPKSAELESLDINQLLRRVLALVRERARTQGIVITERFTFNLPHVRGDYDQLQQVFLNILINAVQATPQHETRPGERTSEIHIVTKYEAGKLAPGAKSSEGEAVLVQVSDTGCGIPAKHLHSIFNPFFTTKEQGQSTGLGLSVAYNIVQSHGGRISAESEEGVGTTVSVSLPVSGKKEG